jgi:hypothetical protein
MSALITRAPLALARSAAGISSPAAAKTIAPSSFPAPGRVLAGPGPRRVGLTA